MFGHASVFNQPTYISPEVGHEQIAPEAFTRALAEEQDVPLLVNHDGLPLARTSSGTLRLGLDETGLTTDADLADTSLGRDVRTLMERGDLTKMSFGFVVRAATMDDIDGVQVRTIRDVDLYDVSIVTLPAYAGTDVSLRNLTIPISPRRHTAAGQYAAIRARVLLSRYAK